MVQNNKTLVHRTQLTLRTDLDLSWLKLGDGKFKPDIFRTRIRQRAEFMINHFRIAIPNLKSQFGYIIRIKDGVAKLKKTYKKRITKTTAKKHRRKRGERDLRAVKSALASKPKMKPTNLNSQTGAKVEEEVEVSKILNFEG